MYSVVCLFPWLPYNYNYRAAVMSVFNLASNEIVSMRIDRRYNTVTFSVGSQEIFNRLSEFYSNILYFPLLGRFILECFAYPESPQMKLLRISGLTNPDMTSGLNGFLSQFGTVLYQRYLSSVAPLLSNIRADSIGIVLLMRDGTMTETNDTAVSSTATPSTHRSPGNGQEAQQTSRAVPSVPVVGTRSGGTTYYIPTASPAVGLPNTCYLPGYYLYPGTSVQQEVYPYQYQGPQITMVQANEAHQQGWEPRRHRGRFNRGRHSAMMEEYDPPQAPLEEERTRREASPSDEYETVGDQNPEDSSDEEEQE